MKALLIIDMQNDFLPGGALAVSDGDKIISEINALQSQYDLVVATQDWHPSNHASFVTQHTGKTVNEQISLQGLAQTLWPEHCVQDSWGAALSSQLDQKKIAAIFRKGMDPEVDSYSGFFDNAKKHSTGLYGYLKDKDIVDIDVCGLTADYCVYASALDALELGFQTTILTQATKAIDEQNFAKQKEVFNAKGGHIL